MEQPPESSINNNNSDGESDTIPPSPKKIYKTQKQQKNTQNTKPQKYIHKPIVLHKQQSKSLNLLHVNAADMKNKAEDLKNKIKYFDSSIVSIQETHFRKKVDLSLITFMRLKQ